MFHFFFFFLFHSPPCLQWASGSGKRRKHLGRIPGNIHLCNTTPGTQLPPRPILAPFLCQAPPWSLGFKEKVLEQHFPTCTCARLVKHSQGYSGEARKPGAPLSHCLSPSSSREFPPPCLARAFFHPATFSELQLQPPCACSGFLLLSEGLRGQDLVCAAVRTLPTAVLCWDLRPPYPEPARKKGEAGNLSSLQVLPPPTTSS